jgi:hypothetical protein
MITFCKKFTDLFKRDFGFGEFITLRNFLYAKVDGAVDKRDPAETFNRASGAIRTLEWIKGKYACSKDTINEMNVFIDLLRDVAADAKNISMLMASKQEPAKIDAGSD